LRFVICTYSKKRTGDYSCPSETGKHTNELVETKDKVLTTLLIPSRVFFRGIVIFAFKLETAPDSGVKQGRRIKYTS